MIDPVCSGTAVLVASTAILTTAVLSLFKHLLWPTHPKIIPGPLQTVIPRLSKGQLDQLEYKPDAFPGARDVITPYGSIRVYEWGPETGPKVLFIHGISTSSMTLGRLAHTLVEEKGCRVMLFDLFGRGFSDGVGDLPHDARLYTSQTLLALASSPLPWTGSSAFSLVGYSLGGGVAVHFAGSFPHMVSSLILLAPAGLIRAEAFGVVTNFIFTAGLVPERILAAVTKSRLQRPIAASRRGRPGGEGGEGGNTDSSNSPSPSSSNNKNSGPETKKGTTDPISASLAEAAPLNPLADPNPDPEPTPLELRVLRYVHWMLTHHAGFIPAFMSCIRSAPLVGQTDAWRRLALRPRRSTAVILAEDDEIIDPTRYACDALPLLGGEEQVLWTVVPGGHDFPMTHPRETLREIYRALDQ